MREARGQPQKNKLYKGDNKMIKKWKVIVINQPNKEQEEKMIENYKKRLESLLAREIEREVKE